MELVFAAVGTTPEYGSASRPLLHALGLINPTVRELPEMLCEFERPFIVDDSAYRAAFGPFENTPRADAIRATADWYRRRQ